MPFFGDYETVGDCYERHRDHDYEATVWLVRKSGAPEGRGQLALKCIAPRSRPAARKADGTEFLAADRNLEFIAVFKQLKQAQAAGARQIAPLQDFGTSPEGAWYVTEFFERKSLKALVNRKVRMDDAILRHVVASVISGCLALQSACGRTHGNLKLSNVLLGGQKQPLRNTPLLLVDPRPVIPAGGSNPFEAQDLKALGEIILQLVEGRLFETGYDYNYPIAPAPPWARLGKEGENWRNRCNQWLDPQLALDQINLARLAQEFKVKGSNRGLLIVGGVVVLAGLAGGAFFFLRPHPPANGQIPVATTETHLLPPVINVPPAPVATPTNPPAPAVDPAELARQAALKKENNYQAAVSQARDALASQDFVAAIQQANLALVAKPDDAEANQLLAQATTALQTAAAAARYVAEMSAGQAALAVSNYDEVIFQVEAALTNRPGDASAITLRTAALQARAELQVIKTAAQNNQAVLRQAQERFANADYGFTNDPAFLALTNQPAFAQLLVQALDAASKAATLVAEKARAGQVAAATQAELNQIQSRLANADYGFTNDPAFLALTNQPAFAQLLAQALDGATKAAAQLAEQAKADQISAANQALLTQDRNRFQQADYAFTNDPAFLPLTNQPDFKTLLDQAVTEAGQLAKLTVFQQQSDARGAASYYQTLTINKPPFNAIYQWATNQVAITQLQTDAFIAARQKYDAGAYDQVLPGLAAWINTPDYSDLATKVAAATNELAQINLWLASGDYDKIAGAVELTGSDQFKNWRAQAATEQLTLNTALGNYTNGVYNFTNDPAFLRLTNKPPFWNVFQLSWQKGAQVEQDYQAKIQDGNAAVAKNDSVTALADATAALALKPGDATATELQAKAQFGDALAKVRQTFVNDPATASQNLPGFLKLKPTDPDVLDLQTKLQKLLLLDNQVRDLMKAYGVPASGKTIDPTKSPVAKYSGSAMSDAALADLDKLQKVIVPQYPHDWLNTERNSCIKALVDKMTMSAQ